ncbi:MAG: hypothetical protein HQL51_01950 [Magnetococcales bacterium]|nr:hypothetical protein [Magnetococcales bacterium]
MNLFRFVYLGLAVGAAVALPLVAIQLDKNYQELLGAQAKAELLTRSQVSRAEYLEQLRSYKVYAGKVNQFVTQAKQANLSQPSWITYGVDINKQAVGVAEMRVILSNARSGLNYYFNPEKFELLAMASPDFGTPPPGVQYLPGFEGKVSSGKLDVEPGSVVALTLKGSYYVTQQ